LAGVLINTALLNLQFNVFGINRYVANAFAIAAVVAWNYWLNLRLSWRVSQVQKLRRDAAAVGEICGEVNTSGTRLGAE
jgi:hypothetical protein